MLQQKGFKEHPVDAYRYFVGDGIEMLVQRAFPEDSIASLELDRLVAAVKEEYSRRWADHTRSYPGIAEMLDYLEKKQVPKAIFSNKPHEYTVLTTEALLPDWHFAAISGIRDGTPRKPNPYGALIIADQLQIEPQQIVYLGDTNIDMITAVAAGMYPVGALWGFRSADELLDGGAKMLAETPQALTDLFR